MNLQDPVLVFDLGGTKVAAGVLLPGYHLAAPTEIKTEAAAGPERVVARIVALGQQVLARFADAYPSLPAPRIAGVASAPQVDRSTGVVVYATFHLPGWTGLPLGPQLAAGLGLPVMVDNDVNCHALAEATCGAGRNFRHFLLAAVGTGIGGGIVVDGRVYRGYLGGAGEIGQLCVEPHGGRPCSGDLSGCLEAYAASSVMVKDSGYPSIQSLAAAYLAGLEIPAVTVAAQWLGRGLAMIAHILAPEAILVGGSAGLLGERYLVHVRASFEDHLLTSHQATPVLFTQLGANSGLVGAGLLTIEDPPGPERT
jgi:glucokinase